MTKNGEIGKNEATKKLFTLLRIKIVALFYCKQMTTKIASSIVQSYRYQYNTLLLCSRQYGLFDFLKIIKI